MADATPELVDVDIQGKTVLERVDVAQRAGGVNRAAILDIPDVSAGTRLWIGVRPHKVAGTPTLCGMEIIGGGP